MIEARRQEDDILDGGRRRTVDGDNRHKYVLRAGNSVDAAPPDRGNQPSR